MILPLYGLLLSMPAGFFWLWYVYRKSLFHPPPILLVAAAFICGMFSTAGVIFISEGVEAIAPGVRVLGQTPRLYAQGFYYIVMVGFVEELCKMLSVRLTVYYSPRFDDAVHGVIFSSAAALGFATIENARYVDVHGTEVLLGRYIMSTFGHVLLSMIWGFAMGVEKTAHAGRSVLISGLLLAAFMHGLYDLLLVYDQMWLALLLLFVLWRVFVGQIDAVARESPHRPRLSRRVRECAACHAVVRGEGMFCGACGRAMPGEGAGFCALCLKSVDPADRVCPHCAALIP
ncbi:MAG: PrsW family intramembrane metalloprotease [Armatimonadetes bacterium]|nr:PrsW family intramembrane metalloprotease [Armatimonadota bacterium]